MVKLYHVLIINIYMTGYNQKSIYKNNYQKKN